jgi:hypothetical protein
MKLKNKLKKDEPETTKRWDIFTSKHNQHHFSAAEKQ